MVDTPFPLFIKVHVKAFDEKIAIRKMNMIKVNEESYMLTENRRKTFNRFTCVWDKNVMLCETAEKSFNARVFSRT